MITYNECAGNDAVLLSIMLFSRYGGLRLDRTSELPTSGFVLRSAISKLGEGREWIRITEGVLGRGFARPVIEENVVAIRVMK